MLTFFFSHSTVATEVEGFVEQATKQLKIKLIVSSKFIVFWDSLNSVFWGTFPWPFYIHLVQKNTHIVLNIYLYIFIIYPLVDTFACI